MVRISKRWLAALAALFLPVAAHADPTEMPQVITPPEVISDPNGLNLMTGKVLAQRPTISIPAAPRLSFSKASDWFIYYDGQTSTTEPGTGKYAVTTGTDRSEAFECDTNDCFSRTSSSSWSGGAVAGTYTQEKTNASYVFLLKVLDSTNSTKGIRYTTHYVNTITYPDGEKLTFTYETYIPGDTQTKRLKKVTSNTGYFLQFDYWDSISGGALRFKTVGIYASASPPPAPALAKLDYSSDGNQVTDMLNRTWTCNSDCGSSLGATPWRTTDVLTLPGEGSAALTYTRDPTNTFLTQSVNRDGVNWTYSYGGVEAQYVALLTSYRYSSMQVSGPNGYARSYTFKTFDHGSTSSQRYEMWGVLSSTDELNRRTDYTVSDNAPHLVTSITYPEGNSVLLEYADGLVTKRTDRAKPGSGLLDIVQQASYGAHYPWRPDWFKDGLGHQTDYVHSGTTGQLTQQLDPPNAAGVRRETDISYTVTNNISRKTLVRICGQTTTCAGSAESHTEYTYFGNTFLPATMTVKNEATGETRVTTYTYDAAGRLLAEDGPRTDVDDTKYFQYDAFGRTCWELGAPDANNLRIAKHYIYRAADDKTATVETGTATAMAANCTVQNFTLLDQTDTTYDSRRYPIREARSAGGSVRTVTDRSFLDRGLADCTTVRMNLTAPLPIPDSTSACTLYTAGTQGPDRITHNVYDNAAQLLKIQKAYRITTANGFPQTLQQDYATYTYTNNGKTQFVTDANGNKASYTYDGFDRLQKWNFPAPNGPPGTVSATDFEQYGYDAAGNRLSLKRRDGRTLTFTYDNLNRMLSKLVPDGCPPIQPAGTGCPASTATRDVFYGYDVMGRQLTAKFDSQAGADGITNSYDGFGNLASSQISMGGFTKAICSAAQPCLYDADNNRKQVTVDGQSFTYSFDARDRPTQIAELGQTEMIGYSYDAFSRPSVLGRRNARNTYYEYDPISRLSALTNTSFTSPSDVRFDYGFNPANQLTSQARTNDSYAFDGLVAVNRNYSVNGLNQYLVAGPAAFTYDASGNLTGDGTNSYIYDAENRLVSATAAGVTATLTYDPLGRLWRVQKGAADTRFLYDGDALVAEYNSAGIMTRRYVHGPNTAADDPLVQYDGADLSIRRFLETDHQGNVILVSDNAGGTVATNRYDEYGIPSSGNFGRFQYTGQIWLSELGVYHYKGRLYSPTLGRFLQIDPIGYEDQINLYEYVGNDPITFVDKSGERKDVYHYSNGQLVIVQTFSNNGTQFSDADIAAMGNNLSGTTSTGEKLTVSLVPGNDPTALQINPNPLLNDTSQNPLDRSHIDAIGGRDIQIAPNAQGPTTVGHEIAHGLIAGDQYRGGVDVNGQVLPADVPGPTNLMKNGTGQANQQTLDEIARSADKGADTVQVCVVTAVDTVCE